MVLTCQKGKILFPNTVLAEGDVSFSYRDYVSLSDHAVYHLDKDYITLQGNATLDNQGDFVKGDNIMFDLVNQSILSGGRSRIKLSTERFEE